jgi:general secretion pathway protein I
MSRAPTKNAPPGGCAGFSLLEVLVAFAILAVSLAVIVQIYQTGLRGAALVEEYAQATQLAESRLAEVGPLVPFHPGSETGVYAERFHWVRNVTDVQGVDEERVAMAGVRPYRLEVVVAWPEADGPHSVALSTVRLARLSETDDSFSAGQAGLLRAPRGGSDGR